MRDRENGFGMKKEEKAWKVERDKVDHDQAENKKANKNKQPQDLRGFFQGGAMESEKKGVRQARERLEQVEAREQGMTTLTRLKKRQPGSGEKEKVEPSPVLKICFGPPTADFWSVWSSQKARKFRQIRPTT